MEMTKRRALVDRIKRQGLLSSDQSLPIVSLEDFFVGNDDPGSIGCNLLEHPGI
jgi:hypothetical protein